MANPTRNGKVSKIEEVSDESRAIEQFFETREFNWQGHPITAVVDEQTAKLYNKYFPVLRAERGIDAQIRKTAAREVRKRKSITRDDAQVLAENRFNGWIMQTQLSVALWALVQGDLLKAVKGQDGKRGIDCRLDDLTIPNDYWDEVVGFQDPWADEKETEARMTFSSSNIIEVGVALVTQLVKDPTVKRVLSPMATKLVTLARIYEGGAEEDDDEVGFLYNQLAEILSRNVQPSDYVDEREPTVIRGYVTPGQPDGETRMVSGDESPEA